MPESGIVGEPSPPMQEVNRPVPSRKISAVGLLDKVTKADVVAMTAPREIIHAVQPMPSCVKAEASGSAFPSVFHFAIPVSTTATAIYKTVHIPKLARIPIGISR